MTSLGYARSDLLVDTDWLQQNLDDPGIRIVDCDQIDSYRRAHIKNAVGIRVHHYVKQPEYAEDPNAYPLVAPPDVFAELMSGMGVGNNTQVVAYDGFGGLYATRFWWVLNYYGHTNVKVVNGGWKKWFDEGRPVSLDSPERRQADFVPRAQPDLLCTLDYGVSQVGDGDTVFLDVRSDAEWDGTNDRGNRRAGHVPGAVHLEWLNLLTDDRHQTFKPAAEVRATLEALGVTPDKQVITY